MLGQAFLSAPAGLRAKRSIKDRNQVLLAGYAAMIAADLAFALMPSYIGAARRFPAASRPHLPTMHETAAHVSPLLPTLSAYRMQRCAVHLHEGAGLSERLHLGRAGPTSAGLCCAGAECRAVRVRRHVRRQPVCGRAHGADARRDARHGGLLHPRHQRARHRAHHRHLLVLHRLHLWCARAAHHPSLQPRPGRAVNKPCIHLSMSAVHAALCGLAKPNPEGRSSRSVPLARCPRMGAGGPLAQDWRG